jgi:hypothetical protein
MKYDVGKLEGGYRLVHIQKTKKYLFLAQAIIILVFAVYLMVAEGGFSMRPFFLSVNSFIYFVLIMLLVMTFEGFVFILLEMRFMRSDSAKFIVTQRSFRTSVLVVVVMLLVLMVLWAPILPEMVETNMDEKGSVSSSSSVTPGIATVFNTDALGLTMVDTIEMESTGLAEVFILTEDNYELFKSDGKEVLGAYRINTDYLADPEVLVDFPETDHSRFYILVYSLEDGAVTVEYTMTKHVSTSLINYLPLLLLIFLVANVVWAVYMFTLNRHFKQGIYR